MAIKEDLLNPKRRNGPAAPLAVVVLLALVGGAFVLGRLSTGGGPAPVEGDASATRTVEPESLADGDEGVDAGAADGAAGAGAVAGAAGAGAGGTGQAAAAEVRHAAPLAPGALLPGTGSLRRVAAKVEGSLAATITRAVGPEVGDPLTLVSSRLLVWFMDVARDLRPADEFELVYELPDGSEPVVHALSFRSSKLDRTIRAYRYEVPGAKFARYFDEEGQEIEQRLVDSPITDYEQVTSLLKDGRRHKGVDFKAPVGTPVTMPWSGVVRRKNWNYRVNGGSLEIEDGKGRRILFLHLSEIEKGIGPGSRVAKGQRVALSGNTGRSTAPHLHYQVMSSAGKVLDPFDLHRTRRERIPAGHMEEFRAAAARLDRLLGSPASVSADAAN
ncbi:MAG TPA: M23 family metallopeptidase [Vulgatibacter sp.]